MGNVFRLKSSTMFVRADEEIKESPLRVVFLSVEGNKTERQYFEYIEKYRDKLGIKAAVHLHTLQRAKKDTLSVRIVGRIPGNKKYVSFTREITEGYS